MNYVTRHALRRVRERWPAASRAPQTRILERIAECINRARDQGELVRVPGGTFVPFSYKGEEGFLVLKKRSVITAVGVEYCPEVTQYLESKRRNGKHQQVREDVDSVPPDSVG
jgi:hypothetical protein